MPGRDVRGSNAEPLGNRNRHGLGADRGDRDGRDGRNIERDRAAVRESMMALQPPTREEVARTIFVGGLAEGNAPDDAAIESVLRCAGKLRRWTRARDAEDRVCRFGFAEYEDVESLEAANEILIDVEVPVGGGKRDEESGEVKKAKLLVVVDEASKKYIEEWKGRRREDDDARQFRIDGCREDMRQCLTSLANAGAFAANAINANGVAPNGIDVEMQNGNGSAEVVTIPVTLEDELSDIPAEMRATVAEEIKAFRDRSNRRDIERLRKEEEMEHAERQRSIANNRLSRLATPPSGPAGGIPSGPRGAPSGPKGYRGAQLPKDYANGVSFINSSGMTNEDEDAEESDSELEARRQAKKHAALEQEYAEAERRWLNRERTRAAAQEREKTREANERREVEREKGMIAKRLREWDDEEEMRLEREEYYFDRSGWLRKRGAYKEREAKEDERDRMREREERGFAGQDVKMEGVEHHLAVKSEAGEQAVGGSALGFKMSLGGAMARKPAPTTAPGRIGDVEGLLEDAEDEATAAAGTRRPELKPLAPTSAADLTDEEKADAKKDLALSIPVDADSLFAWPIQWQHLTPALLASQIRPVVEKRVVESLGLQEEAVVDALMEGLRERKGARELVGLVEDVLEEESTEVVRRIWRVLVFSTEVGGGGLG